MSDQNVEPSTEGWFDKENNIRKVLRVLFVACAVFLVVDIVYWATGYDKHPYLKWETWPGFYAVYGFVACVVLTLAAKYILRPLVKRSEDFYTKGGDDA